MNLSRNILLLLAALSTMPVSRAFSDELSSSRPRSLGAEDTTSSCSSNSTVLILGAGATGLAAAYELEQSGITNYIIIEASDQIGGRMKSAAFGGRTVQVGANWVQGTEGSWLWDLVQKANITGTFSDWDNVVLPVEGDDSRYYDYYDQLSDAWDREEETVECMSTVADEVRKNGESDMSLRQAQKLCGWGTFQDKFSELAEYWTFDFEFADTPVTTSLKNAWPVSVYEMYEDEDFKINDSRGWLPLFDLFKIPSSKILLNTTVTKIESDGMGGVRIAGEKRNDDAQTNITLSADYVICTFSLGVLQKDHKSLFNPPLPDWYLREMFKFDMNTYTIIYLRFPYSFWDDETYLFLYADDQRGYYPIWENLGAVYDDKEYHVLTVTVTGEEAMRIARQTDEKTKAEAMEVLKTMFGPDIPECLEIIVPKWLQDPLFRGSYSNWPIGLTKADSTKLGTPIERVFIRGEASHPNQNGWIHGALLEGQQTAKEIKFCMDDESSTVCKCAYDRKCSTYDLKMQTNQSPKKKKKCKGSKKSKSSKKKARKPKKSH